MQQTNITTGLTAAEVAKAPKNIPAHHVSTLEMAFTVARGQILSFFFILLIISGILSVVLGETIDGTIFFVIAAINAVIGFFQEFRANKSAQTLEKMVAHMVTVRRDGVLIQIPHTDVVLGDIAILGPGDIAVVDVLIRECTDAFLDESVVTGETMPRQAGVNDEIPSGATVSAGSIVGQVIAVGKESSLIKYAQMIAKVQKSSNFEKFIHTISKTIMIVTVACLAVVLIVNVLITHGMAFSEYVLYGISMLVGVVPESLPLIVTIILTREALALARQQVLIKKLSALQNLGSMNFLFTDKTGTLTENNLQVKTIVEQHPDIQQTLLAIAVGEYERTPMDSVFDTAISNYLNMPSEPVPLQLSPFQVERGYAVYTFPNGNQVIRGQYQHVADACNIDTVSFLETCSEYECQGLRIIAVAEKTSTESNYVLQGAIVFEDPLKNDALSMYQALEDLGVDVKVITGDSLEVAKYVGNILHPKTLNHFAFSMDDWKPDGTNAIEDYFIYARCKPEQKSVLIDEHLDHGVVGFVGEGINDAMALKRADIGFVVSNGSDVARQSGDVILLEKSLNPIVTAVRMSREAFMKIRTYLLCTLTGNIGTLFSLTTVVVFWQQIPMLPIQILLNNILTDLPLMFLITDRISAESVKRPIRDEAGKFFKIIVIFAAISSLFDFLFFFTFRGYDISVLRTGWFVFSVIAELTLVFSLRSELSLFKSPKMSKILGVVLVACYIIAIALPFLSFGSLFKLIPLTLLQIALLIGIAVVYLCANELAKKFVFARK
jgi:Mg2+-importing ATPase